MEHKLITGGEQWLPFARSRIKALRATGLAHASQKFEVEGALIDVRIEPGHEYIRISGGVPEAYLETGVLTWQFRGLGDPRWGEAAKWRFTDIPTTSKYLGKIVSGGENVGEQRNKPPLVDSQDSVAIGYPKAKSGSIPERETKDAETEKKYRDSTYAKKKLMGMFPASVFSGKMRLYMQSLYGAREVEKMEDSPFIFDESGLVPVGMFRGKAKDGGNTLFIRPESMGVFTAPDNTYWLLDINSGPGKVLVFKINTSKASGLVKALAENGEDREKLEAYIFANSHIEIPVQNKLVYASGYFNMPPGSEIAYGWKWNTDGSKASIVVHETLGNDVIADTCWFARTVHLTFSYSEQTDPAICPISVTSEVVVHNKWIDGWGDYNIFAPEVPTAYAPLNLHSLRAGAGYIPPIIEFPRTPIYGWYVDDVWTPVELSCTTTPWSTYLATSSNVVYPNGSSCPQTGNPFWAGKTNGNTGYTVETLERSYTGGRSLHFGSFSYEGYSGTLNDAKVEWLPSTGEDDNHPSGRAEWLGTWNADGSADYPNSNDYNALHAAAPPDRTLYFRSVWQTAININTSRSGNETKVFAVVIPGGDAEAFYLATYQVRSEGDVVTTNVMYGQGKALIFYNVSPEAPYGVTLGYYMGWLPLGFIVNPPTGQSSSWSSGGDTVYGPPTTTTTEFLAPVEETNVYCFNRTENGLIGEPGGSYYALFNCAYTHPYYDRGMYTYTSNGGRYAMSEAPSKPSNLPGTAFVGWA